MNNRLYKLMNWPRIEGIIYSEEDRPHEILGPHIVGKSVLFQTFQPGAGKVSLITEDGNGNGGRGRLFCRACGGKNS